MLSDVILDAIVAISEAQQREADLDISVSEDKDSFKMVNELKKHMQAVALHLAHKKHHNKFAQIVAEIQK